MSKKTLYTEDFDQKYYYAGDDLGASYTPESTTFKVWAPTAEAVILNLYRTGDAKAEDRTERWAMTYGNAGVWTLMLTGDRKGTYYTYTVDFGSRMEEDICDPYAKAVGVNGDRAMVIDLAGTNPEGWEEDGNPNRDRIPTEAVIYEVSLRDMTADSSAGCMKPGTYAGLTEEGTVNSFGQSTGLDHMKQLGITHVQLMPSYDFATIDESRSPEGQYNWGYDPKNYNVPEGSFSSNPYDGAVRIKEYKEMVHRLHGNGLSVVMDVVYNHTFDTDFCYNRLVPGYFHRQDSNGSGCGNDVASERLMVRKFIVDSVTYWAREYHLDGFRFDLVGLLDAETIQELTDRVHAIKPSALLYGEGWIMDTQTCREGTLLANQTNAKQIRDFAMFNDTIRDGVRGSVFIPTDKGYVNGNTELTETIVDSLQGRTAWNESPAQLINYVSCHDNLTLWDKINSSNAGDSYEDRVRQNLLAAALVFTSRGIPFLLSGEEMLRTKTREDGTFDENSFVSGDVVNSIKWDRLSEETHRKVYEYYRGLIAFRKAHPLLAGMDRAGVSYEALATEDGVIALAVRPDSRKESGRLTEASSKNTELVMIYNSNKIATEIALPAGEWNIFVMGDMAGTKALDKVSGTVRVEPISAMILEHMI